MNPDLAHSIVARCLTDPDFLLRAHARSRSSGLGEGTAEDMAAELLGDGELERLRRFLGFITKVKHNALRRRIPATLGLMGALGIELAFFCDFSSAYVAARREGPLKPREHLELMSGALSEFLGNQADANAVAVTETFSHERLLFDLINSEPTVIETEHIRWRGQMALVPKTVDVVRVCNRLGARAFAMSDIVMRAHILCYWRPDNTGSVSLYEVDAPTAALFSALRVGGGPTKTRHMLARAGMSRLLRGQLHTTALAAVQLGFLELRGDWLR